MKLNKTDLFTQCMIANSTQRKHKNNNLVNVFNILYNLNLYISKNEKLKEKTKTKYK